MLGGDASVSPDRYSYHIDEPAAGSQNQANLVNRRGRTGTNLRRHTQVSGYICICRLNYSNIRLITIVILLIRI